MASRSAIGARCSGTWLAETMAVVIEPQGSRCPLNEETIDNISGLMLAKDLIPVWRDPPRRFMVKDVMRPVHVVPGSREVEEVLADFKRLKAHMAVVLDDNGGTAGIVTMEDLLEEIVGEILDEHDEAEQPPPVVAEAAVLVAADRNIGVLDERFAW